MTRYKLYNYEELTFVVNRTTIDDSDGEKASSVQSYSDLSITRNSFMNRF